MRVGAYKSNALKHGGCHLDKTDAPHRRSSHAISRALSIAVILVSTLTVLNIVWQNLHYCHGAVHHVCAGQVGKITAVLYM